MADTSAPVVSRSNTFSPEKLYKAVRFQQGRPVLDTELNDLQDMNLEQFLGLLRLDESFEGVETGPFDWAFGPVSSKASSPRNNDNFSISVGRLPTSRGIIDTLRNRDPNSRIIYDYFAIDNAGLNEAGDLPYENYLYKGTISSVDAANPRTVFTDLSKRFLASNRLTATEDLFALPANQTGSNVTFKVKTSACRVVFTTSTNQANQGVAVDIQSHTSNEITVGAGLPADVVVGDQYYIIPANELSEARAAWDAANGRDTLLMTDANPLCVSFVQNWDEDISSAEDSDIELNAAGVETTHRTQLRWCVRVARISMDAEIRSSLVTKVDADSTLQTIVNQISDATSDLARRFGSSLARPEGDQVSDPLVVGATAQPWLFDEDNGNTIYSDAGLLKHSMLNLETSILADESTRLDAIRGSKDFFRSYRGLYYSRGITPSHFYYGGDNSFLSWRMIKALLLAAFHSGIPDVDAHETDLICLAAWCAPSKRLHREFLAEPTSAKYQALVNNGDVVEATGADTLSPKMYPNTTKTFEIDFTADYEHPRLCFAATAEYGIDKYDAQRSVFFTPPRVFLRKSEMSEEILSSRSSTYGLSPTGAFGLIQDQFIPAEVQNIRLLADKFGAEDGSGRISSMPRVTESLRERLSILETAILGLSGLSAASQLLPLSGVPSTGIDAFGDGSPQNSANKLLKSSHTQGIAQAGVSADPISTLDADYAALSAIRQLTTYENNKATIGGIFFGDPLKEGKSFPEGLRPEQDGSSTYYSRESIDENSPEYSIGRDSKEGWSGRAGLERQREWHEGLSSAVAFSKAFQLRKLAIKTTSHESADLFTINVPMWWNNRNSDRIVQILSDDGVFDGVTYSLPQASMDEILSLDYQVLDPLTSASGAVRSHLANPEANGPMGISSYQGVGYIPAVGTLNGVLEDGNSRNYNKGETATNTRLLPFLDKISGSQDLSLMKYGETANANVSKLFQDDTGAWGRRHTSISELVRLSKAKADGTLTAKNPLPSVSTTENRCTAMRIRYHIGDFYPGAPDSRGTPTNLLVDSLNLFVRVEPLPLVHWMTMPKHQHSIIEGSLDMSEAIATLLDLSNGRGIPDHLFSTSLSHTDEDGNTQAHSKLDYAYLIDSSADNHRGSGLRSITSMDELSDPSSNMVGAYPIMSSWLSRVGTSLLKLIQPAWKSDHHPQTSAPQSAHLLSAVMAEDLHETISSIMQNEDPNYADNYSQLLLGLIASESAHVDVGSIDPLRIAIPNQAQPHIHWYHPNMGAITAPNHGNSPLQYTDKLVDSNGNHKVHNLMYQPYPMWDRSSLVAPALVPFDSALPQRLQIISTWARDVDQDGVGDTWSQLWGKLDPDNQMSYEQRLNSLPVASLYAGVMDFDSSILSQEFLFNLTGSGVNTDTERAEEGALRFGSFLPYMAHASGLFGPGNASITVQNEQKGVSSPNRTAYTTNNNGIYDVWGNWFPYIVNPRLQRNTNDDRDFINGIDTSPLSSRLNGLIFNERPRPVFFPASMMAMNNSVNGSYQSGEDANDATNLGDPILNDGGATQNYSINTGDLAGLVNSGYHPFLRSTTELLQQGNLPYGDYAAQFSQDSRSFSWDGGTQRILQILGSLAVGESVDLDQQGSTSLDGLVAGEVRDFTHPTMRAALSTHTVGWLNLYTKTYSETYGHTPLHPYGDLTTHETKPAWHTDYSDSIGRVAGKGADKSVDTLYAGDMGTSVATTVRNNFLDPLCFGMGAVKIDGSLVHDSLQTNTVRDIFELAYIERLSRESILTASGSSSAPLYTGLRTAYSAFSKMGMQNKLLYNCSFRVLHSRPGGAVKTTPNGIEQNYGQVATPPKSLTEMFLSVSADNNELRALPRNNYSSANQKPYIQVEPMYDTGVAANEQHPNRDWMMPLRSMVSDTLSMAMASSGQGNITLDANGLIQGDSLEGAISESLASTVTAGRPLSRTTAGDAYAADPFDTAWDDSIGLADSDKSLPVANSAQNSGVEYELISSLTRLHASASQMNLDAVIGDGVSTLQDTVVMPNELTLPGDHEIVFVLYTGDRGNQLKTDVPMGLNPPVAGCRISATVEVNRPSERYDSGIPANLTDSASIHYGSTVPSHLSISNQIEGIRVQTVAGGRPSLKI